MNNYTFYRIICCDPNITDCYVGSTVNFNRRKRHHKGDCNNPKSYKYNIKLYQFIRENLGWDNWKMIEIETASFDKTNALIRERYWVEFFKATLNTCIPSRTQTEWIIEHKEEIKEYNANWYIENKEEIKEHHATYRNEHKEEIKEYQATYYIQNKEEIAHRRSQKMTCDCGGCYTLCHKSHHLKTKKHIAYENLTFS